MYAQPQSNKCCIFKGSYTIYIVEKFLWWAGIHKTLHKHISKWKNLRSSKYLPSPNTISNWKYLKMWKCFWKRKKKKTEVVSSQTYNVVYFIVFTVHRIKIMRVYKIEKYGKSKIIPFSNKNWFLPLKCFYLSCSTCLEKDNVLAELFFNHQTSPT